jgi:ABC-2 type transport system permease protein
MNKILLIIKREYLTRVRKKSFIVMSILGPLLFGLIMIVPIWLATVDGDEKIVEVIDESGLFEGKFLQIGSVKFEYSTSDLEAAKKSIPEGKKYGLLFIPEISIDQPYGITFFSQASPSVSVISSMERTIKTELENMKLERSGISPEVLSGLKSKVSIQTINMTNAGEKTGSSEMASVVGYVGAFLIYFFIFFFGSLIMRGVMEEKTNRIVEVIVSSVKPFQLMLGKIIGTAGVGLTQLGIWIVLTFGIYASVMAIFKVDQFQAAAGNPMMAQQMKMSPVEMQQAQDISSAFEAFHSLDFGLIVVSFIFFFLGGYLLYGALFAAVGSVVENDTDIQQFMLPITIPLIVSIVCLAAVITDPHGNLAFWMSMIPFTSPVVMMMRVPFNVPLWQLILSMSLVVLGFIFTTWLAGRIYRVGILMHGAKVNYKTVAKWFMQSN